MQDTEFIVQSRVAAGIAIAHVTAGGMLYVGNSAAVLRSPCLDHQICAKNQGRLHNTGQNCRSVLTTHY